MKKFYLPASLLLGYCLTTSAGATSVAFSDFSNTSTLTLNGSAAAVSTTDGSVLRLTRATAGQSGSAFNTATIQTSTFSTYFSFRITNPGGSLFDGNTETGADGLVFVVQNVSASIGGAGQGIGYAGIEHSVGVEFDTWHNSANNDPDSNHIAIDTNGNVNHGVGSPNTLPIGQRFDDGNIWHAWVDYNGTTLEVRANQTGLRPLTSMLSQTLDISNLLNSSIGYVGFTSGTGSDWGNHDILSWEYRDSYQPITNAVPEPTTMLLFGTGILGVACMRRKK